MLYNVVMIGLYTVMIELKEITLNRTSTNPMELIYYQDIFLSSLFYHSSYQTSVIHEKYDGNLRLD